MTCYWINIQLRSSTACLFDIMQVKVKCVISAPVASPNKGKNDGWLQTSFRNTVDIKRLHTSVKMPGFCDVKNETKINHFNVNYNLYN